MFAAGILLFLLVDIFADAVGQTSAAWHTGSVAVAGWLTVLLIGGFGLGLVGLVVVNNRIVGAARAVGSQQKSLVIATGIGLRNLSEGLAIGASAAAGQTGLAFGLVAGFAAHNAIEGFGIVGPTLKEGQTSLVAAVGASWSHRRWPHACRRAARVRVDLSGAFGVRLGPGGRCVAVCAAGAAAGRAAANPAGPGCLGVGRIHRSSPWPAASECCCG